MTEKLYLSDTYAFSGNAKVLSIEKLVTVFKNSMYKVVLDKTVFHPQGGGQPSDIGNITLNTDGVVDIAAPSISIQFAQAAAEGVVEHFGNFVSTDDPESLPADAVEQLFAGQVVSMSVDREVRLANAKCHSAGHLIDVSVNRFNDRLAAQYPGYYLAWLPTKGYHFKDGPYVEYKGKLEYSLHPGTIAPTAPAMPVDADLIAAITAEAEELIRQELPTEVRLVPRAEVPQFCGGYSAEELEHYPEQVRLVQLAGQYIPCGGTHVAGSGELGGLKITKIKHKKGVVKVSYNITTQAL